MLKRHNIEQNTDEWLAMRGGKLTSSNLTCVMAHIDKGKFGDPAIKYAIDIATEIITGEHIPSNFSNSHTDRGHEEEPMARLEYEKHYFCETTDGGFYCNDRIGCSPDFLIGDDGVGEIKSAQPSIQYGRLEKAEQGDDIEANLKVIGSYKWQCIANLLFTGRDWLDFVSYCSSFPGEKSLIIRRIHKSDLADEFEQIQGRIEEFMKLVDKSVAFIRSEK